MTQEFQITALGEQFRVVVDGMAEADFAALRRQWSRMAGSGETSRTVTVAAGRHDPDADVSGSTLVEVSAALRQTINRQAIEARQTDLLSFHAAGLADPETGDVIALVGPSGAGKSTAAAVLGAALGYVSDETVAVWPSGEVFAIPAPLAFRRPGENAKRVEGPDELGLLTAEPELRLTRIALLQRVDEPMTPTIEPVSLLEVLDEVIAQTNYFGSLPLALTLLDRHVRRCGGVEVIRYHDVADLTEPIRELLARPTGSEIYTRGEVDDWVALDGEVLLLKDGRVSELSPLASLIWQLLDVPQPVSHLAVDAERAFGRAPDGDAARVIHSLLEGLAAEGIVWSSRDEPGAATGDPTPLTAPVPPTTERKGP